MPSANDAGPRLMACKLVSGDQELKGGRKDFESHWRTKESTTERKTCKREGEALAGSICCVGRTGWERNRQQQRKDRRTQFPDFGWTIWILNIQLFLKAEAEVLPFLVAVWCFVDRLKQNKATFEEKAVEHSKTCLPSVQSFETLLPRMLYPPTPREFSFLYLSQIYSGVY